MRILIFTSCCILVGGTLTIANAQTAQSGTTTSDTTNTADTGAGAGTNQTDPYDATTPGASGTSNDPLFGSSTGANTNDVPTTQNTTPNAGAGAFNQPGASAGNAPDAFNTLPGQTNQLNSNSTGAAFPQSGVNDTNRVNQPNINQSNQNAPIQAGASAQAQNQDWRMVYYNGRWWYYTPQQSWMYQDNNQWQVFNGTASARASRSAQLNNAARQRVQAGYRGNDGANAGVDNPRTANGQNNPAMSARPNAPTEAQLRGIERRLRADARAGISPTVQNPNLPQGTGSNNVNGNNPAAQNQTNNGNPNAPNAGVNPNNANPNGVVNPAAPNTNGAGPTAPNAGAGALGTGAGSPGTPGTTNGAGAGGSSGTGAGGPGTGGAGAGGGGTR